ncbi:hypothetical protein EIP86_000168 [Pleurotus ostreatoroseus]|nr:hypothetical protein EIP86_000168 [Pleurotus ostreatoroseus]
MKISRFIKLRTFSHDAADLALEQNHNPLKRKVQIIDPSKDFTTKSLDEYRAPLDPDQARREPVLRDKMGSGWLAWRNTVDAYLLPPEQTSVLLPWDPSNAAAVAAIREVAVEASFWAKLAKHYSAENHSDVIVQDNASCVKSIYQLLEDEPFEAMKPTLEELLGDNDKNKQRGAAELLAGLISGSKHWPTEKQKKLWEWFKPYIPKAFEHSNNDLVSIWTSFLEHTFFNKDPRRVQPLVDYLIEEFNTVDFNAESTFDVVKVLCFFRAFYEELNWKFSAWTDEVLRRCWPEIASEHDDVLAYISEIMAFCGKIMRRPNFSTPLVEDVVYECRTVSLDMDIMHVRGSYHQGRVTELVKRFKIWREERLPGVRAFQSTYDRVGILVCRWLFQTIHDTNATSAFDYLLPLMPELFRFTEINDNDDLAQRAKILLNRMCGVMPPRPLLYPVLDSFFSAIQTSPSWRVRLKILPLVQVYYFRQGPCITEGKVIEMLEVICRCLDDEVVEVREMAATTLSGILRVSPRRSVINLKARSPLYSRPSPSDRFVRLAKSSTLPDRQAPHYASALRQRHAAILGICALVESYPYTVERWMPELLTNVLAEHTYDPIPISSTVRRCARNFRKTHQDTWHEDQRRFTEDQLAALSTLLTGSSYCMCFAISVRC